MTTTEERFNAVIEKLNDEGIYSDFVTQECLPCAGELHEYFAGGNRFVVAHFEDYMSKYDEYEETAIDPEPFKWVNGGTELFVNVYDYHYGDCSDCSYDEHGNIVHTETPNICSWGKPEEEKFEAKWSTLHFIYSDAVTALVLITTFRENGFVVEDWKEDEYVIVSI